MNSKLRLLKFSFLILSSPLLLTACGNDVSNTGDPGALRVVGVDSQDFDADRYQTIAGEVTFEYVLDGFQAHTLVVEGFEDQLRLAVSNGGTAVGSLTLGPGKYFIYCDIPGHRSSGMEAQLLVHRKLLP